MAKNPRPVTNPVNSRYFDGPMRVKNETGGSLTRGTLVRVSGIDAASELRNVVKADADASGGAAEWIVLKDIANGGIGAVGRRCRLTGQNTNAATSAEDPVYLSAATAGTWTVTDPTDGDPNGLAQIVGYVVVKSATVGVVDLRIDDLPVQIGTNEIQDGSVMAAKLGSDVTTTVVVDDVTVELAGGTTIQVKDNGVSGAKIPEIALGEIEQTAVVLDHADVSPKELLAADATNERIVWVRAVATQAAAGAPDIDVGSATTDTNGIVHDFAAGAWAVGDRFEGMIRLPAGEALVATIAAAGTAGTFDVFITAVTPQIQRAQLVEDALQFIPVPLTNVLAEDGALLTAAEEAGTFNRAIGTNQLYIEGEVTQNETEASVGWFEFYLPENYVAAGDVKIRAVVDVQGAGTLGSCTIDFEARESDNDGAIGADLVTTAAQAITATAGAKDFTVTATGLVAGDKLVVKMTTSVVENADAGTLKAVITKLGVLCDVKG